jgi:hypothetical protein
VGRYCRGRQFIDATSRFDLAQWSSEAKSNFPLGSGDHRPDEAAFNALVVRNALDWGVAWSDRAWQHMLPLFAEFKRLSELHRFQLLLVIFPVRSQVEAAGLFDYPQQRFARVADELDCPALDLLPVLRKAHQEATESLFHDMCHHTAYGNAIVAEAIFDFLGANLVQREQLQATVRRVHAPSAPTRGLQAPPTTDRDLPS